jgi:ribosomal-protein-alanine N-acetyltransferase
MYQIRSAIQNDLLIIQKINEKCLPENYPIEIYNQHFDNWKDLIFVATTEKVIVGYIMCYMELMKINKKTVPVGHITSLAILPEHRGHKLGYRLMLSVLVNMKKNYHAKQATLHTRESNDTAKHIYTRLGFITKKLIKDYYSNPKENGLLLVKKL